LPDGDGSCKAGPTGGCFVLSEGDLRKPCGLNWTEVGRAILACVRGLRLDISAEVTISGDD